MKAKDNKEGVYYPLYITSKEHEKLLVVQSSPISKIWFKDEEITVDELVEMLNEIEKYEGK